MTKDPKLDLETLRHLLNLPAESAAPTEPTEFALHVGAVLTKAVSALREQGVIEVEEPNLEALSSEIANVALEMSSLKKLPQRLVNTLMRSDLVEEVYGTDSEIGTALRPFLDEL